MKFDDDVAIQKAMRHFSSCALARIIMHKRGMADCFRRNMNNICWHIVENELAELEGETPEHTFNRFVKEYALASKDGRGQAESK
jgi:hypothetical protein